MVAINSGARSEQCLVHFHAAAHLDGTDRIGGDRLIHVAKPGEAWGSAAGATLRDAVRLEGASGLKNNFVDFAHGVRRIERRLMVMLGVVAGRGGVNIVELVAVEAPIADETFG